MIKTLKQTFKLEKCNLMFYEKKSKKKKTYLDTITFNRKSCSI